MTKPDSVESSVLDNVVAGVRDLADRQARLILDNAVDYAIVGLDLAGAITSWNVGAERIMGWSADQAIGRPVDLFFTSEDVDARISTVEMTAALRHGRGIDERWHLRQDGSRFWANGEMMPLYNEGGALEGYVKILRDRTEQHYVAAALSETEDRYRTLHDAIDEGFCLIEVRCDDAVKPVDYRFVEVNPAFERQTGIIDAPGQWMRDIAPEHEQHWFDMYAKVATTGVSTRFELPAQALDGRWYEVFAYRVGRPEERLVAILFSDITERRASVDRLRVSEEHLRSLNATLRASEADLKRADFLRLALADLSDQIRDEGDPGTISRIAGSIVGETLGADLVGYGIVDPVAETITVDADWTAPDAVSLMGVARFRDYGVYIDDLKSGRTVIVHDAYTDPRTREFADALAERSAVAFVNIPIQERGAFVALLYVSHGSARAWSEEELSFIREVAARVRSAAERARSDQTLRALNEHLEGEVAQRTGAYDELWNGSVDLLVIAGMDGYYKRVNPAFTTTLGWSAEELTTRPFAELWHPDDAAANEAAMRDLASGISAISYENRYRRKDGSYCWISWNVIPRGDALLGLGRDLTEAKERQAALEATEEALRQAQKMEAVGQLTGGLAHDFNNLLTGMMGNLELLQLRVARGRLDDLDRFINAAQGAGRRAASLTQRLLAFSRRQTLDPRPTDVNRLVSGLEDMLQRTVGSTAHIDIVAAAGLWTANIDAAQLENAILNLCINGRDAMVDGGKLTIETANQLVDEPSGRERDLEPGQYVSICVTDTGTGMSAATIARAFEPFYTTKPIGQGTGLGLSMIYGFARQSGGQVRISSEVGQGTTVCIYLPRHYGEAGELIEDGATGLVQGSSAHTVLVVDDEATIRHLIDEVLDDLGYTVIGAADGAAGIKVLQSGAKIELLITDVGLPNGMNGRQVADAARSLRPGLKVLFITGFADNVAVGNGHLEPGMELLTKPFTLEALSLKVAEMLKA